MAFFTLTNYARLCVGTGTFAGSVVGINESIEAKKFVEGTNTSTGEKMWYIFARSGDKAAIGILYGALAGASLPFLLPITFGTYLSLRLT